SDRVLHERMDLRPLDDSNERSGNGQWLSRFAERTDGDRWTLFTVRVPLSVACLEPNGEHISIEVPRRHAIVVDDNSLSCARHPEEQRDEGSLSTDTDPSLRSG